MNFLYLINLTFLSVIFLNDNVKCDTNTKQNITKCLIRSDAFSNEFLSFKNETSNKNNYVHLYPFSYIDDITDLVWEFIHYQDNLVLIRTLKSKLYLCGSDMFVKTYMFRLVKTINSNKRLLNVKEKSMIGWNCVWKMIDIDEKSDKSNFLLNFEYNDMIFADRQSSGSSNHRNVYLWNSSNKKHSKVSCFKWKIECQINLFDSFFD